MIYIYIVLLCFQNSCHLLSYCCGAVENLSRNRARIVFQTKGVINDDERQTNGDKNGEKSEKKNKDKKRGQGEERLLLAIFDSNIKNEHVPAGHTTNRSRGMKVLDTERRYSGGNSRRTGADTLGERMGFTLPDGSFTLLVIVADSRQRQWKELLGV